MIGRTRRIKNNERVLRCVGRREEAGDFKVG
jgi:hypothetical protein